MTASRRQRQGGSQPISSPSMFQRWMLNFGATLGTLCLLFVAATLVFGLKPLIFSSGSMAPAIPTGALALAVPVSAEQVHAGEVVSLITSDGVRVTHRVISANPTVGLVLKGDANAIADLQTYKAESVDRVLFSIPGLGYVASWLATPWAWMLGGLFCSYLIFLAFFRRDTDVPPAKVSDRSTPSITKEASPIEGGLITSQCTEVGGVQVESGSGWHAARSAGAAAMVLALVTGLGIDAGASYTEAAFSGSATGTAQTTALTLQPVSGALGCATTGGVAGIGTSAKVSWSPLPILPKGARYALRLTTTAGPTYGYTDVPSGATSSAYGPGLNLLGLVTGGSKRNLAVKLFIVYTTDGQPVNSTGSNIGWSTPESTSPVRTIAYHPGLLLARYFSCT